MSWGLDVLELGQDADERSIKRAYAKRLRVTRPDDDPVAFQQLHEAYQAALSWVQQHPRAPSGDDPGMPWEPSVEAGQDVPLPDPPAVHDAVMHGHDPVRLVEDRGTSFAVPAHASTPTEAPLRSIETMVADILQKLRTPDGVVPAADLAAWLQAQPELWSLQGKPRIGWGVLEQLQEQAPPVHRDVFDALATGFGWDDVHSGIDAMQLQWIAHRCEQAWLMSPAGQRTLAWQVSQRQGTVTLPDMPAVLERLRRPRSRWRNVLQALPRSRPDTTVFTLAVLGYWPERQVPPGLSAPQVAFWSRFGSRDDPMRFRIGSLRAWLAGVFCGLVCLLGVVNSWPLAPSEGGLPGSSVAALVLAIGTVLIPAGWYLWSGLRRLILWQSEPAPSGDGRRIALIPLLVLAIAGVLLGLGYASVAPLLDVVLGRGLVFALVMLALAGVNGQRHRLGKADEHTIDRFAFFPGMVLPWLGLLIALGYWAYGLLLRRRQPGQY
ncbi:molecular chaperone DnaJ [Stenotrophomonas sp. 24(2023)]|uniref:molecular chaperone DnaJ n=1 Tax=Stenotrophomonas sp. 24(2023) TaxID=3068324 RepID=UPI0027DEBDE4|nr:molecular chaperone DnaJ [Stenotrophomonas sp. 24(2023)]WMJ71011.1 molecular chaperone DnaJ [Stenotrophomonas sp. 24(2023)]